MRTSSPSQKLLKGSWRLVISSHDLPLTPKKKQKKQSKLTGDTEVLESLQALDGWLAVILELADEVLGRSRLGGEH